ncbi:MAG: ABC transporter substrate-binding protein [bacterium]|nr:ABC transporter substrate-binding protein [bacterium]
MKITTLIVCVFLCLFSFRPLYAVNRVYAAERVIVSVIYSSDNEQYQQAWEGFKSFLTAKNVALWISKYILKEQSPEKILAQISAEKPDFILTLGTKATKLAQANFKDIPIVFALVLEPEMIEAPNVSGVLMDIPAKLKLEYLKKIYGANKKIGVIYSEKSSAELAELQQTCKELDWPLVSKKIVSEKQFPDALRNIRPQIECFIMLPDTTIYFPQSVRYLLQESIKEKFPVVGLSRFYSKDGALISFDCDYLELGRQAGEIALKIIDGAKPSDLPPVMPRQVKVSLNLAIAEKLALEIPAAIKREAAYIYGNTNR